EYVILTEGRIENNRSILRVTNEVVCFNRQAAAQQLRSQSKVRFLGQFPLKKREGVRRLRSGEHRIVEGRVDGLCCVGAITCRNLVVTQLTPACTQLQEVYSTNSFHEGLFGYYPA